MRSLVILALLALTLCADEYPKEENVIVLTDDTFDAFIGSHENVLVKFYAPWCGHCKKLAPEYSKAAVALEKENLFLAQVDATAQKKLAEKYQIQGYPTLKLFSNGAVIEYNGGRTEKDIITWMKKKTGPATATLKTVEDVEKFKEGSDVVVVYFGEDKTQKEAFEKVAKQNEEVQFATVDTKEVLENYKVKAGTVVLFKKFDEGRNDLTEVTEAKITEFINAHSTPLVMKFDDKCAQVIFGKNQPGLFLYRDKNSEKTAELDKLMSEIAPEVSGKLQVVVTDIKEGLESRLAEYIGVKAEELPTVRIHDTKVDLKKYNMAGEITKENILKFVKDWEDGKLKPTLKSQEIPKEQKGVVYTLVGKSFDQEVINSDKDVLVKFYAPWCGHCKALAPEYEKLAKQLAGNKKLLIAEIDATENEVEQVHITGFPTIKFWPAGKKDKPLDYNGDRKAEAFVKWLQEKATNPIVVEEEKKEEKEEEKKEDKKDAEKGDL